MKALCCTLIYNSKLFLPYNVLSLKTLKNSVSPDEEIVVFFHHDITSVLIGSSLNVSASCRSRLSLVQLVLISYLPVRTPPPLNVQSNCRSVTGVECVELVDDVVFVKPIACCLGNKEKLNTFQIVVLVL